MPPGGTTDQAPTVPNNLGLYQNYPNPFNPTTTIQFDLPQQSIVTLKIYDMLGQEVNVLLENKLYQAGHYTAQFDASHLASGIYFYRLSTPTFTQMRKMLLLR